MKTHTFNLTVKTSLSHNDARLAVLAAFAGRQPDDCEMSIAPQIRRPLAPGEKYVFPGYPGNGFTCLALSFPGHPSDDGGLPGVLVKWNNRSGGKWWYPFATEEAFWNDIRFQTGVSDEGGPCHWNPAPLSTVPNEPAIFCCAKCGHVEKITLPSYTETPSTHAHWNEGGLELWEMVPVNELARNLRSSSNPSASDHQP